MRLFRTALALSVLCMAVPAHAQSATGIITGTWVNAAPVPPATASTRTGTEMWYSPDGGATWAKGCTGAAAAVTCKSGSVPVGIYKTRFKATATDPQYDSDWVQGPTVGGVKELAPGTTSATFSVNP